MGNAKVYSPEDLYVGLKVSYEREITEDDIFAFAELSGDRNPLHVDAEYAKSSNYQGRIAHGAFQVGLASAMLGMHLPGEKVLLVSINSRFPVPLYFPNEIKITGEITAWNRQNLGGQLKVIIQESKSKNTTAEIFMGFTLHEERLKRMPEKNRSEFTARRDGQAAPHDKLVLLTGASGGLATPILDALTNDYQILALTNRQPLDKRFSDLPNVEEIKADIAESLLEEYLSSVIGERSLYGIVHAAWLGVPRSGLLASDDDVIVSQLKFGTTIPVRLARTLFKHAPPHGGRFIAIGSTAGTINPYLQTGAYSLGKASMEHTVKLLAPELARKKITANVVSPSFVSVGFNKQATERQIMTESAAVPLGRVCDVDDVIGLVRYLLSPESSFVSGQVIGLTGARI